MTNWLKKKAYDKDSEEFQDMVESYERWDLSTRASACVDRVNECIDTEYWKEEEEEIKLQIDTCLASGVSKEELTAAFEKEFKGNEDVWTGGQIRMVRSLLK